MVREALKRQIAELGLAQADISRSTGLDPATVSDLFTGSRESFSAKTLGLVARALGWTTDSIARVDRGEPPRLLADGTTKWPDERRPAALSGFPIEDLDEVETAMLTTTLEMIRAKREAEGR